MSFYRVRHVECPDFVALAGTSLSISKQIAARSDVLRKFERPAVVVHVDPDRRLFALEPCVPTMPDAVPLGTGGAMLQLCRTAVVRQILSALGYELVDPRRGVRVPATWDDVDRMIIAHMGTATPADRIRKAGAASRSKTSGRQAGPPSSSERLHASAAR